MGLFDWLTSTKRPGSGVAPLDPGQVREAILAVNRPTAPFQIVDGSDEGVDLIAEWKIVDAQWYEIFAKAGLEKVFRIKMKLDAADHEVRAVDEEYEVSWRAGAPTLELAVSKFRGQKQSIQFGTAYAFTEEFLPGQVYKYRFSTGEMKDPIQDAVTAAGWTYKGVSFGKL
ncbi:MAG TPA: hypothetical protein VD767_04035 [Thermomicrobiales bacterium]|nr:hypothetical protein [Thermomicrobiales bacterium]